MDTSVKALQEAISIRRQIENLEQRLSSLLRGGAPTTTTRPARGRYFSPGTRAKLAAAARAKAGHTMRVRRMTCKVKSSRLEWENSERRWLNQPERFLRARTSNWCALRT